MSKGSEKLASQAAFLLASISDITFSVSLGSGVKWCSLNNSFARLFARRYISIEPAISQMWAPFLVDYSRYPLVLSEIPEGVFICQKTATRACSSNRFQGLRVFFNRNTAHNVTDHADNLIGNHHHFH